VARTAVLADDVNKFAGTRRFGFDWLLFGGGDIG
jgi:hypothetical protein